MTSSGVADDDQLGCGEKDASELVSNANGTVKRKMTSQGSTLRTGRVENLTGYVGHKERFKNCARPLQNITEFPVLQECLPDNYTYHVCEFKIIATTKDPQNYEAQIRVALKSPADVQMWVGKMKGTPWRVERTRPKKGHRILLKTDYRCQHRTRWAVKGKHRNSKNTDCPATMSITLLRSEISNGRHSRSSDPHMPVYPVIVKLHDVHNHNPDEPETLPHRDIPEGALQNEAGRSPSSHPDGPMVLSSADPATRPDLPLCYRNPTFGKSSERLCCRKESPLPHTSAASTATTSSSTASPPAANSSPPAADLLRVYHMFEELSSMVRQNPNLLAPGLSMAKAFEKLKNNPSGLISAMHAFGTFGSDSFATRRSAGLRRTSLDTGPTNSAQPTSAARRKCNSGERRGRPKRVITDPDHTYGEQKRSRSKSPLNSNLTVR